MPATTPCEKCGGAIAVTYVDGRLGLAPHTCTPSGAPRGGSGRALVRRLRTGVAGDWTCHAFRPAARRRGGSLTLWLPRTPRAEEGPNGRVWQTKSRATKAWHELVRLALEQLGAPAPTWRAVSIDYDVFRRGPEHDRDNLVIALGKPVQDALVAAGVIPGDDPRAVVRTPQIEQPRSPLPFGFVVVRVRRSEARLA